MKRPSPGGRIDDRLDAGRADGAQLLDRVGDADVLVPVARAPDVAVVLQRLRLQDEDVLVHQRGAESLTSTGPRTVSTVLTPQAYGWPLAYGGTMSPSAH